MQGELISIDSDLRQPNNQIAHDLRSSEKVIADQAIKDNNTVGTLTGEVAKENAREADGLISRLDALNVVIEAGYKPGRRPRRRRPNVIGLRFRTRSVMQRTNCRSQSRCSNKHRARSICSMKFA